MNTIKVMTVFNQGYIFWPFPPWGGNLSKLKNREEFEGGLKNRKNLKKPVIKVPKNREEF